MDIRRKMFSMWLRIYDNLLEPWQRVTEQSCDKQFDGMNGTLSEIRKFPRKIE